MVSSRLSLYNGALRELGSREIASLTEGRESRRVMDGIWNDGAVNYCLLQGFWKWSIRSQMITYDPNVSPGFGYQYAFELPDDFIRIYSICSDEDFDNPIIRYSDEAGYIYTDYDTIYLQYVSNDTDYGLNYSLWPEAFVQYVQQYMASQGCIRLTQNQSKKDAIDKALKKSLIDARSKDAMNMPVKFMHPGTWTMSRVRGRWGNFNAVLPST